VDEPIALEDEMDKLLLTPVEAARALGIGRSTVYELMRAGTLGSVHIGSCRRIPAEDLAALVSLLREAGPAGAAAASSADRRVG
jgi:excisionase family DNA binding protein